MVERWIVSQCSGIDVYGFHSHRGDDPELRAAIDRGYFSEAPGDAAIQRAIGLSAERHLEGPVKLLELILSMRESGLGPSWGTQDDRRIKHARELLSQFEDKCNEARQDLYSDYFVPTDTQVLVGDDPVLRGAIDKGFFSKQAQGQAAIQRAIWLRGQGRPRDAAELLMRGEGANRGNLGLREVRQQMRAGKLRDQCEADYAASTSDTPASVFMANIGYQRSFSEDEYEGDK
jgi:hypothetical protein